ncbi:ligase-associated DNA damage response DEXH box helicase [bacterium]|nr:ligase-associated DNA damage response DEXH box helicase [bacterium]
MPSRKQAPLPKRFQDWFATKGWEPHAHQMEMLQAARENHSSLLIAPTGGGKTLAGFLPSLVELADNQKPFLHSIYISPLKALAADIQRNLAAPIADMQLPITIEMRTGDTPASRKQRQFKKPPHILLTTPESLELILSHAEATGLMQNLQRVIIDEVHSLAPGKRGHLTALCVARLRSMRPELQVFGLSATVAEPENLASWLHEDTRIIHAKTQAVPNIRLLKGDKVPWSGYMSAYAVEDIYISIQKARNSIVFVNTRAQAEFLFQKLWEANSDSLPIALHHGSLDKQHRLNVEAKMAEGKLRAVVATASLDMGLDWGAVDLVIQVGAPKGISRLLQRIGRSNHRLDEPSDAVLVPCNRFEMIECMAVMDAIADGEIDGEPLRQGSLDVLAQFIMNCACAGQFSSEELYRQLIKAHPYRYLTQDIFDRVVRFVADGGYSLKAYDRFHRIEQNEEGLWHATPMAIRRHRMNTGTIVEYETLRVSMRRTGSRRKTDLGRIEEYFVQGLSPGDTFIFAGRMLSYKGVHEMTVEVEPAKGSKPKIPSFKGGRLPLSISLADRVRHLMHDEGEWEHLPPLIRSWLSLQRKRSALPGEDRLLTESFPDEKLEYLVIYSFAGRNANQTLGLLLTQQMEMQGLLPLGFVATDYAVGFWGLKPVDDSETLIKAALTQENSEEWVESSQMARRVFREIAVISGLVERGNPGKRKTGKQVTMSTDLIYDVLRKYEPDHILLTATRQEVNEKLSDIERLQTLVAGITIEHHNLDRISPLAVPLLLEIGIERIKGKGESALLDSATLDRKGDGLLKKAAA